MKHNFFAAGIGASAGGIPALKNLSNSSAILM